MTTLRKPVRSPFMVTHSHISLPPYSLKVFHFRVIKLSESPPFVNFEPLLGRKLATCGRNDEKQ